MGEVYRAEDTKLGREVAIKVLPQVVAQDPERLARFEREAKVLASLNHPSIAAIYSLESATAGAEAGRFKPHPGAGRPESDTGDSAGAEARPYKGAAGLYTGRVSIIEGREPTFRAR